MADDKINLEFLAHQNERVLTEVGSMRDDMRVMSAIIGRMDAQLGRMDVRVSHTDEIMAALLTELRAMHAQSSRMNDRVRKLENQP